MTNAERAKQILEGARDMPELGDRVEQALHDAEARGRLRGMEEAAEVVRTAEWAGHADLEDIEATIRALAGGGKP